MAKTITGTHAGNTVITASYGGLSVSNFYVGSTSYSQFTVSALSLATVGSIDTIANQTYNGSAKKINPTVKVTATGVGTNVTLTKDTDYTVSWSSDADTTSCIIPGTVTVTVSGIGNYTGTITTTYQIVPATITAKTSGQSSVINQSYVWTGNLQGVGLTATTAGSQTATIKYGTTSGSYTLTTAPQARNVSDSTTVYYQITANYHNTLTGSYTLTITKADAALPTTWEGASKSYDAAQSSPASLTYTGYSGGTIKFKYDTSGGTSYGSETTTAPTRSTIGNTKVVCKVYGDANHNDTAWSSPVTLTVNASTDAQMEITLTDRTYTGSAQTIANATSGTVHGIDTYYIGYIKDNATAPTNDSQVTWGSANGVLTATNAGTYYIYYKFTPDTNHSNTKTTTYVGTVTIGRANTATASAVTGLVYNGTTETNGTAQTGVSGQYVTWTGTQSATNAGSYSATATPDSNHTWEDGTTTGQTINWSIAKRGQGAPTLTGSSVQYHNTATVTVSTAGKVANGTANCPGTLYYKADVNGGTNYGSATTTAPTRTALGTTKVIAYYAATANNFSASSNSAAVSLIVTQSDDAYVTAARNTTTLTYSGSAQTLATVTEYEGCTYYLGYKKGSAATADSQITWMAANTALTATDAGTYYVYYKFTPDSNHSNSQTYTAITGNTVTIGRAKTATASAITGLVYNGTTETNGTAQTGVSGQYVSWGGTTTGTNAGSYSATATPDSNHAWSDGTYAAQTINWSIARRGQTAPTLAGDSKTYHLTASASVATPGKVANGTANAPGTLTWTNQTRTALGSQTATAYYAATTTNFSASPVSEGVTVEITKASDASVTAARNTATLTYDGTAKTLATVSSYEGCSYYLGYKKGSAATVDSQITWMAANTALTATDAGTYYVYYKFTPDSNHSNSQSYTAISGNTVVINRAKTATASAVTGLTYNGTTETNGTAQTGVTGTYVTWSGSQTGTNAGSYSATATPDSNHAWSDGSTTAQTINWSIARRAQTAPTVTGATTTYPTAASATATAGKVYGSTATAPGTLTWSNQTRTVAGTQTAEAWHAATTTNFSESPHATATVTVNVGEGEITYTTKNDSLYCTSTANAMSSTDAQKSASVANASATSSTNTGETITYTITVKKGTTDITGAMAWSINSTGTTVTIPSGTAAGTYTATITASVPATANYSAASTTKTSTVTINAVTLSSLVMTLGANSIAYGSTTTVTQVKATYSNTAYKDVKDDATYTSDPTGIVTIS